jgi:hypothetical protein
MAANVAPPTSEAVRMGRPTGDLTTPRNRTVTAAEAAALRRKVLTCLYGAWRATLGGWAVLAAIAAAAAGLDWLMNRRQWLFLQAELLVLGIFVVVALVHSRRLLALSTLDGLEVYQAEVVVDSSGFAQLHTREGFRRQRMFGSNYRLYRLTSKEFLSPDQVWRVDLVRTRRGGPEQYFVLAAEPVRPSTEEERQALEAFLWAVRVYHRNID